MTFSCIYFLFYYFVDNLIQNNLLRKAVLWTAELNIKLSISQIDSFYVTLWEDTRLHFRHIKQSSKVGQAGFITQKFSWLGKQIHTGKNTWRKHGSVTRRGTREENAVIYDTRQEDGLAKTGHYTLPICANRKMIDKVELIYVGLTIIVVGEHTRQEQSESQTL